MSVNITFVATVGKWPSLRADEVLAALKAWAFSDEGFSRDEVEVDILGGGPANPIVRMEAYTPGPLIMHNFEEWVRSAEARLRARVEPAGGSEITLFVDSPDE